MSALLTGESRRKTESQRDTAGVGPATGVQPAASRPQLTAEKARQLVVVALLPSAVSLTVVAAAVLGSLAAAQSGYTGAAGAVAAGWLGLQQVPLMVSGTQLGLLPLAPTIWLAWLVFRRSARVSPRLSCTAERRWLVGAAVAGPLVVALVCLAVIKDASGVVALSPPNTLAVLGWVIGIHGVASAAGAFGGQWREVIKGQGLPDWTPAAVLAGLRAVGWLLIAATVLVVVLIGAHWSTATNMSTTADGAVGTLSLLVLSMLYLPNVVVGAASVLVGSSVHVGPASLALFAVVGGPVPAVPVMAAVPTGPPAYWWLALLLVPVAIGISVGRECADLNLDRWTAAKAAAVSATVASAVGLALAMLAGGDLGAFGHIGAEIPNVGVMIFGWIVLFGAATAAVSGRRRVEPAEPAESEPAGPVPTSPPLSLPSGRAGGVTVEAEILGDAPATVVASDAADIIDAEVVSNDADDPKGAD
ncbi:hypothetical protein FOS14_10490 [Skermania sp. ID1734]|uniref:cell division protein PerM n=1 Tax=Skermania sp. ID1734 TaxID=2597516 RepID=UPI00117EEE39|nr:DUF6350 family protein [Skermania sp. ID1734]TSD99692.1 hypothetical protein FOS14_10490 [Skermania sp. ID1734]